MFSEQPHLNNKRSCLVKDNFENSVHSEIHKNEKNIHLSPVRTKSIESQVKIPDMKFGK